MKRFIPVKEATSAVAKLLTVGTNGEASGARTVCVEGNIGVGKTVFMRALKEKIERAHGKNCVNMMTEPVNKWNNIGGEKLFDLMMTDTKRWAFTFQNYVQLTMYETHKLAVPNVHDKERKLNLIERSLHSARWVFVENHKIKGNLATVEEAVLDEYYKFFCDELERLKCDVDLFIYLKTSPEVCLERIAKRINSKGGTFSGEEKRITLEYLKSLEYFHEHVLFRKDEFKNVICIDSGSDEESLVSLINV